jgi:acetylornithine deacetylase/succinyl-diaminopimelate desuccinylase-like protein
MTPDRRLEPAELLEQLVAIDSVNPTLVPGGAGEAEIGRFVAGWLEENGLEVAVEELAPGRVNVVGRAHGTGGGRTLLLNAHLDTVGLGGPDAGIVPRVENGRLYGRGAYDMKGGLAAIMLAGAAAAGSGLRGDVVVTAVADEEALSIGSERIAATIRADAAIVAEPTELRLAIAHRGFAWLELETSGRAAHGSRYDLGIDAIVRMAPVLAAVGELDAGLEAARDRHPLLGRASVHASLIEGGQDLASYPGRCLLKVERRTLPGESIEAVEAELRAAAPGATVRAVFVRIPLETPGGSPIVEAVRSSAAGVLGRPPELVGVPFWTDAALFAAAGIPAVVFGAGGEGAHAEAEWVELADVGRLAAILARVAAEFCG